MKSQWFEYKEQAILLRKRGNSLKSINKTLGIPLSTLSGWLKDIELTRDQKLKLQQLSSEGLTRARFKANEWHRNQKALRIHKAEKDADAVLANLELSSEVLDLAFAMLYMGEGAKRNTSSIASSDAMILKFVLAILRKNYGLSNSSVKCELHLRADQDPSELKKHWSKTLNIPLENFRYCAIDKRTEGRKTYDTYKGVCVIYCGDIAIQRKLIYLYTKFCDKVSKL